MSCFWRLCLPRSVQIFLPQVFSVRLDKADWARKKGRQRKDILTVLAPFTKVRMKIRCAKFLNTLRSVQKQPQTLFWRWFQAKNLNKSRQVSYLISKMPHQLNYASSSQCQRLKHQKSWYGRICTINIAMLHLDLKRGSSTRNQRFIISTECHAVPAIPLHPPFLSFSFLLRL